MDSGPSPRPDQAGYNEPCGLAADVTTKLVKILGKKMTALVGRVNDVRTVEGWMNGRDVDGTLDLERLRLVLRIAEMIHAREDKRVVQAWFMGLNPQLGDRSPARVLRDGDLLTDGKDVLNAAHGFLSGE